MACFLSLGIFSAHIHCVMERADYTEVQSWFNIVQREHVHPSPLFVTGDASVLCVLDDVWSSANLKK